MAPSASSKCRSRRSPHSRSAGPPNGFSRQVVGRNRRRAAHRAPERHQRDAPRRRVERLIGDRGIRGLVIRPRGGQIEQFDNERVRADAPTTINGLVRWTIHRGIAGLEAWAGTPGTVGGAIYGNAHFGGRLIGELVESVRLADREGSTRDLSRDEMEFGYDRSRLQRTGEVLLSAVFRVSTGDPTALRDVARQSLAYRKRTQPLETPSAGCIFQNPDAAEVPADIPASAGALVDRAGSRAWRSASARVSTAHANFIVNEGQATAADIRSLIDLCRSRVARAVWRDAAGRDRLSGRFLMSSLLIEGGRPISARSRSKATRMRRCRCWPPAF